MKFPLSSQTHFGKTQGQRGTYPIREGGKIYKMGPEGKDITVREKEI